MKGNVLSGICISCIACRYIEENYSKIRDVERELANLTMEMKLTAGPKKAGWCIIVTCYSPFGTE